MSHFYSNSISGGPEIYGADHILNVQDISPFLGGDEAHFSFGADCAFTSEKERGPVERQLLGLGGPPYADFHRIGLQATEHPARCLKTPFDSWAHHGLHEEEELTHDAYSSPPTSSRSPCFSDDLTDESLSPRSSVSSQCDMSSSWPYPNIYASYAPPATGYSGVEYTSESIALSSIQAFSDDLPEASVEHHDYPYMQADHQLANGLPSADVDDATNYLSVQAPQADESTEELTSRKRLLATTPLSVMEEDNEDDSDYKPSRWSGSKRRRRLSNATASASQPKTRGHRRTSSEKVGLKRKGSARRPKKSDPARPFPCPLALYGCTSTFTSKNEWKRHVGTQHVKQGFWRCDLCPVSSDLANPIYNDFNRKDLFTQHLRRMHTHDIMGVNHILDTSAEPKDGNIPEEVMTEHQTRCYHHLRQHPLRSGCLFCQQVFEGLGSWEQRMEHLGAHFEREKKNLKMSLDTSRWNDDPELRDWFMQEGLIEADNRGGYRLGDGQPRRNNDLFGV